MTKEELKALIAKYQDGQASAEERAVLESWYNEVAAQPDELAFPETLWDRQEASLTAILGDSRSRQLWPRIRIAIRIAAAVATVVFGLWFFNSGNGILNQAQDEVVGNDIAPGKNGATITLSTGEVIALDSAKSGVVLGEDGLRYSDQTAVVSNVGRDLFNGLGKRSLGTRDDGNGGDDGKKIQLLMASTGPGQTYEFRLSDGTRVFLNADSRISFPARFTGAERRLDLEGEGYFEVAKDSKRRFVVISEGQEVEVLGTHFNVSAYAEDGMIRTTLLEGSVSVTPSSRGSAAKRDLLEGVGKRSLPKGRDDGAAISKMLKPNEQALNDGKMIRVHRVNAEDAIAWKQGLFVFEDEPLVQIMRKIARWYHVEIVYDSGVDKNKRYWGSVSRYERVSSVLDVLQATKNIHFKIEGRRIRVMR